MSLGEVLPAGLASLLTLAVIIALRRLVPPDGRRGRAGQLSAALSLLAVGVVYPARVLGWRRLEGVADFTHDILLPLGIIGAVDLFLFDVVLERWRVHTPRIVRDLLEAAAFLVVVFSVLGLRGVDVLPLVTTSAVLTAVVGLALQSTLSNVFAGLALQLDRAFAIGDWIRVGERVGRIQQIRWRSTTITTVDGDLLVLPNGTLTSTEVLNLSAPTPARRVRVALDLDYRHPPNEVRQALLQAPLGVPGVLSSPEPAVLPIAFGESAVSYALYFWVDDPGISWRAEGEVLSRAWYAVRRAGLEIPFPRRVVEMREARSEEAQDALASRLALLERIDLLAPLEAADRRLLAETMRAERYAAGERIIRQGEAGDSLYLIASGEVSVVLAAKGGERNVATLGASDFFGEMSLVTGEARSATCVAKGDVLTYVVEHQAFQRLLAAKPALAEQISAILARRAGALSLEGEQLTQEAAGRRAEESQRKLLGRIRDFFKLGP